MYMDQLYYYVLPDIESKLKAYGALGHHQMLAPDKLFTVSRHADQPKTNLINLNTVMSTVEVLQ